MAVCITGQDKGGVSWSPRQQEQERPSVPAQTCREPCTLCRMACRTHSAACPSLLAHRAASAQPSAVRRRAATPRSPSAQHRAALSSISRSHRDEGQSSAATTYRRLHRDALPHASLTVTLQHSPGSLTPSLDSPHTVLCDCLRWSSGPSLSLPYSVVLLCGLLPLSVPLATRCSGSVSPVLPGTLSRSFETARRRAVEGITWAALHRLLQLFVIGTQRHDQGSPARTPRCAAAVPLWTPAPPQ